MTTTRGSCRSVKSSCPYPTSTAYTCIRQHTSASVRIRQHSSAYVSMR